MIAATAPERENGNMTDGGRDLPRNAAFRRQESMADLTPWKRIVILFIGAAAVVVLDQLTKYLVAISVPLNSGFEIIPDYFNLVHTRNPGAAFGMFADSASASRRLFFAGVSVFAAVIVVWLALSGEEDSTILSAGYAFFLGGVIGNLVDRIRFGEVIDFLDFHVGTAHWPAFNVADSALCVGTALFLLHLLLRQWLVQSAP